MKRVLLVGFGAEIGATLLGMNNPEEDGFFIDTILTNEIPEDHKNVDVQPIDSLYARLVMAHPQWVKDFAVDYDTPGLVVRGRLTKVVFGDNRDYDLHSLGGTYDVCILATSKTQIGTPAIIERLKEVAKFVIGVAEAPQLPSLYANLIDPPTRFMPNPPQAAGPDERVFAIGSCQSNGWHAPLRAVLEMAERYEFETLDLKGTEVDIVHPDTPTGRLGTKYVEPRQQDPRNNLRPSFSQIEMAMGLLLPDSHKVNSISLRVLTLPPGFQVCRFFLQYTMPGGKRLDTDMIRASFEQTAQDHPHTLGVSHLPLGSRAFEFADAAATVLTSPKYLRFEDNPFGLPAEHAVAELIVQTFVNNVRGYCRSTLDVVGYLCRTATPYIYKRG